MKVRVFRESKGRGRDSVALFVPSLSARQLGIGRGLVDKGQSRQCLIEEAPGVAGSRAHAPARSAALLLTYLAEVEAVEKTAEIGAVNDDAAPGEFRAQFVQG